MTRSVIRLGRQPFLAVLLGIAVLAALPASRASAQATIDPPAPYQPTDSNGVDLASGTIHVPSTRIGVGQPDQGGLSYTATFISPTLGWRHSVWGGIQRKPNTGSTLPYAWYTVTVMGQSVVFTPDSGGYQAIDGKGELTLSGTTWTFTAPDGSIATFDKNLAPGLGYIANQGPITSLVRPSGERIEWTYTANSDGTYRRLQSVNNNLGYQIHFQYNSTPPTIGDKVVAVQAINNGVDACDPVANTCTFSHTWPSLAFTYSTGQYSVTDALSRTLRVISSGGAIVSGIARPTTPTGQNDTIVWGSSARGDVRILSYSNGAGTWTYDYSPAPFPPDASSYDSWTTVTDPLSHTTKYNFHSVDPEAITGQMVTNLTSIVDALNQTTEVIQDASGLQSVTYPEGNRVTYLQNDYGNPSGIITHPKTGTDTVVSAQFDPACSTPISCRRPISITDQLGNVTDYTYNSQGQMLTETRPAATTSAVRPQTRYTYQQLYGWYKNASGTLVQAATPVSRLTGVSACATTASCTSTSDEVVTYTAYQAGSSSVLSNLLPVTSTSGSGDGLLAATTTTTWDANGDAVYVDGPLSGTADTTRTLFDAMRQMVGVIGPDPDDGSSRLYPAIRTTYNADGQVTAVERGTTTAQTDPAWSAFSTLQTSTTEYDAQTRKVRDTAFLGSVNPSITQYTYDTANRQTCVAARMNPATFGSLPTSACTLATTGSSGPDHITFNTFDALDRVLTTSEAYGTPLQRVTRTQAYTTNGKVDWIEDAAGNRSNYVYDAFDRLSRLEFPSATVGAHAPNTSDFEEYGYDASNNPTTKRVRSNQVFTTTFDHLNRAILIDAPSPSADVEYRYDLLNRRTSSSHAVGVLPVNCASATSCSSWDALGRQISETGPLGTMAYQYDLAGRRTRMTWPDAVYVTYAWDLDGSMTAILLSGSSTITAYTYDNLARRTGITRGNGVATTYVWDDASYLTSLSQNPSGSAYDLTYGFTYSPVGQVLGRTMSNSAYDFAPVTASTTYTNNGLNQNTVVGGLGLTWNTQGNLTSDGTKAFTYDAANRLTGTTGSALTHDPLDRLYQMTGTDGGRFIYDETQVAGVYPASGSTLAERYVAGPTPDEWAVIYSGSGTGSPTYPLQNHQASVIALTDSSGVTTSTLAYDAYGLLRAGNLGRFQYTGQMVLPDYGLQYYKARAYSPALGRFVQTDPVGYSTGLNLYAYVGNDPVNNADPTGLVRKGSVEDRDPCTSDFDQTSQCWIAAGGPGSGSGPGPSAHGPPGSLSNGGPPLEEKLIDLRPHNTVSPNLILRAFRFIGRRSAVGVFLEVLLTPTPANSGENQELLVRWVQPTVERIHRGESNPHPRDGTTFQNREGILPSRPEGYYTEYVHPTPGQSGPGGQRVVTGRSGEIYYTPDHYGHFFVVQ